LTLAADAKDKPVEPTPTETKAKDELSKPVEPDTEKLTPVNEAKDRPVEPALPEPKAEIKAEPQKNRTAKGRNHPGSQDRAAGSANTFADKTAGKNNTHKIPTDQQNYGNK